MLTEKRRRASVDLVHSLADDLDVAHDRILNLRIFLKAAMSETGYK